MCKKVSNAHVLFMLDMVMAFVCCNHQDETTLTGSNKVFNTPSFPSVPEVSFPACFSSTTLSSDL